MITELQANNIRYEVIHYNWWTGVRVPVIVRIVRTLLQPFKGVWLAWRLKDFRPDIIYTNTITICVGGIAAKILRCRHMWHIHEFPNNFGFEFDLGRHFSLFLAKRLSNHLVFVSRAVQAAYHELGAINSSILYQSVNRSTIPPSIAIESPRQISRLAIVGTIMPAKGQADAVRAVEHLNDCEIRLDIIGTGDAEHEDCLKRLVRQLGLDSKVFFHGFQHDPRGIVSAADVVLVCSENEAFGRVTAEAMLLGKAIVGSNSGATAELLEDGVTGLLYEFGNTRDLAAKVSRLLQDEDLKIDLGTAARKRALALFSEENYRRRLQDAVKTVMEEDNASL